MKLVGIPEDVLRLTLLEEEVVIELLVEVGVGVGVGIK
ncbi:MAG: hypothetical protein K940chlam9_01737, partial [Chlamydiae bacterium]|nr:hypothetical protein [Chlamydiota bacterium]